MGCFGAVPHSFRFPPGGSFFLGTGNEMHTDVYSNLTQSLQCNRSLYLYLCVCHVVFSEIVIAECFFFSVFSVYMAWKSRVYADDTKSVVCRSM